MKSLFILTGLCFFIFGPGNSKGQNADLKTIQVETESTINVLLSNEDSDHDKQITIDDNGPKRFQLVSADHKKYEVAGTYPLSNLLQELALARDDGKKITEIDYRHIYEKPVNRISRMIKDYFWDGLTRKMDRDGLKQILVDTKMEGSTNLYVPYADQKAWDYYYAFADELKINVVRLPENITPEYVRSINDTPGILALAAETSNGYKPLPFVVPGGRFNEMYGWDSYFINIGLLLSDRIELAKAMVDNHLYQVEYYGKILNANRSYYLTRSQPPFLTSMVREVYSRLDKNESNKTWLKNALQTCIKEYNTVWMSKPRLTENGLSRYYGAGIGMPPETEPGHFDHVLKPYAEKEGMDLKTFTEKYLKRQINVPELDAYFLHDRAMRESGHDTSNRLINSCADLNTVDLNALLYKYEKDIAELIENEFGGSLNNQRSSDWYQKADARKNTMNRLMWDKNSAQYYDYDFKTKHKTGFQSLTNLYPLWAAMVDEDQAKQMVIKALPLFEEAGGLASTTKKSRGPVDEEHPQRQWDYPSGWAPHQILMWVGLNKYGFKEEAQRLAYRWLYLIARNAVDYNGTIPEKYDVVSRTHKVFAEYGNVGTQFDYITREGFGWMNSSFLLGTTLLSTDKIETLNRLIPPEWLFK